MTQDEWAHLIDLDNRLKFDYPSEFEWTKKDKQVLASTLFDLLWGYKEIFGHPADKEQRGEAIRHLKCARDNAPLRSPR